jgi:hypothetical protein
MEQIEKLYAKSKHCYLILEVDSKTDDSFIGKMIRVEDRLKERYIIDQFYSFYIKDFDFSKNFFDKKFHDFTENKIEENRNKVIEEIYNAPKHYDNSKGSIYKFANDQNLNSYEFDIIKRIIRSRKKGNFREDLEKTKFLIDLYLAEYEN